MSTSSQVMNRKAAKKELRSLYTLYSSKVTNGKEEKDSQRLHTVKPHPPIVGLVTRQPGTMNARLLSSAFEGELASLMCLAEPVWLT